MKKPPQFSGGVFSHFEREKKVYFLKEIKTRIEKENKRDKDIKREKKDREKDRVKEMERKRKNIEKC